MKEKYTVYKLLDKNGKVVWIGATIYPIERRLEQHMFQLMNFDGHEVVKTSLTRKQALEEEGRLIKEYIDKEGDLPPYMLRAYG